MWKILPITTFYAIKGRKFCFDRLWNRESHISTRFQWHSCGTSPAYRRIDLALISVIDIHMLDTVHIYIAQCPVTVCGRTHFGLDVKRYGGGNHMPYGFYPPFLTKVEHTVKPCTHGYSCRKVLWYAERAERFGIICHHLLLLLVINFFGIGKIPVAPVVVFSGNGTWL